MQLVGATNTYIRMPFICEGLLDGVIGALLARRHSSRSHAPRCWPRLLEALPWVAAHRGAVRTSLAGVELLGSWALRSASPRRGSPSDATCAREPERARRGVAAGGRARASYRRWPARADRSQQRIEAERAKAAGDPTRSCTTSARQLHAVTLRYNDLQRQLGETNAAIAQRERPHRRTRRAARVNAAPHRLEHRPARRGASVAASCTTSCYAAASSTCTKTATSAT